MVKSSLVGKSNINNFEKTFVIYTSLVLAIISISSFLFNKLFIIGHEIKYVVGVSFIFYMGIFFISRFTNKLFFVKITMSVVSLVFANFLWIYYYNSRGPVFFAFAVYFTLMLFIWDSKKFLYIFLLVLVNIAIFFIIEYFYPEILKTYPNEKVRLWNIYIGLVLYFLVIYIYTVSAKNNYMNQYKKAKESEQLKTAFLHNLSHEIRTPLNAIVGFTSLLVNNKAEKKEKYKKLINENSEHLTRLIEDMIDMSMIETNQFSTKNSKFNLYEVLKNVYEIFHVQVDDDIMLKAELGDENFIIDTDKTRLEQILINLLKNAFKFTKEGSIRFGYQIDKKKIRFYVEDTGIGIEPELKDKIFERFIKGHENSKTVYRGTGIGLFLTQKMVEMLGGEIWVESELNKGSTFYFTIPLTS